MHTSFLFLAILLPTVPTSAPSQQILSETRIVPPPLPAVGSKRVITVTPLVPRPASKGCVVNLFERREFLGEAPYPLSVTAPIACPGPWARIVLESDFDVTAGAQFDRTARVTLGGVNLYTGTTMEPRKAFAPSWHVERDVTDYAAIFAGAALGSATLENHIDEAHAGRIYWRARLVFYTADTVNPAPRTADIVLPLSPEPVAVSAAQPTVERLVTWPRNIERMAIDIIAMPQRDDEMWPLKLESPVFPSGQRRGHAEEYPFRESEVRIDDRLAGFAPVYPWIFTGGMGVWNWTVIPGVGSLDLKPYRVDLTPFAALMNDGKPHRIQVRVVGARDYMATTATLMAWRDAGQAVVTGGITRNTLRPSTIRLARDRVGGSVQATTTDVVARRRGGTTGYIIGSHGRVTTRIDQSMLFRNRNIPRDRGSGQWQDTVLETRTFAKGPDGVRRTRLTERYPFARGQATAGTPSRPRALTDIDQGLFRAEVVSDKQGEVRRVTRQTVSPRILPSDKQSFFPDKVGSTVSIAIHDSRTGCYDRTISVVNDEVIAAVDRCH